MTNRHYLLSYHGTHSDFPQDRRYPKAATIIKVAAGLLVTWLLVTLLMVL